MLCWACLTDTLVAGVGRFTSLTLILRYELSLGTLKIEVVVILLNLS